MIKINYRIRNEDQWKTLEIEPSYFKRSEPMDDEWVAEEINELFYALTTFNEDEDIDDKFEFKATRYWDEIVMPIYELTQASQVNYDLEV